MVGWILQLNSSIIQKMLFCRRPLSCEFWILFSWKLVLKQCKIGRLEVFCKNGVLNYFAKFTGIHVWPSLFLFSCLRTLSPHLYYLKDTGTGVFLWILQKFEVLIFYRTPQHDCFCLWTHGLNWIQIRHSYKTITLVICNRPPFNLGWLFSGQKHSCELYPIKFVS